MAKAKPKDLTQLALDNIKRGVARREIPDGHTRGLFLIVQPTGRMAWAVRYRFKGQPRKYTIGACPGIGIKEARALAARALVSVASGGDPAAEKQAAKAPRPADDLDLVEKVVPLFVERYAKVQQKAATAYETERILNREIVSRWRGRRLSEIGKADIHELLESIVDRGSPIQANRTFAALRKMCGWAASERGLIAASPCTGIKPPAPEKSRDRVLSNNEIVGVWKAGEGLGWPFGPAIKLMFLTGQRRSEIAEMRWREIDFDARAWILPRERAKNDQAHAVPLSDPAIAIRASLPRVAGKGGYVFSTNGETPISGFAKAKERLGAALPPEMPGWTLHDLRRTFASGCARLGIAVHVVEAALNHKSGTIRGVAAVYNRYSYDTEKRAAMDTWGRYVQSLVNSEPGGNIVRLWAGA